MQVCPWHRWLNSLSIGWDSLVLWFPTSPSLTGVSTQRKLWWSSVTFSFYFPRQWPNNFSKLSHIWFFFFLQTDMDSTNVYAYISIIALFVCLPPAIIVSNSNHYIPLDFILMQYRPNITPANLSSLYRSRVLNCWSTASTMQLLKWVWLSSFQTSFG